MPAPWHSCPQSPLKRCRDVEMPPRRTRLFLAVRATPAPDREDARGPSAGAGAQTDKMQHGRTVECYAAVKRKDHSDTCYNMDNLQSVFLSDERLKATSTVWCHRPRFPEEANA